ncbi:hypothetical protein H2204_007430 [Knufia peltigerae]|uniref:Uncharacterized protein n=1 Tax=Knufia peltigerae TaxID=1002370 RepID=A0AA38Y1V8_9EURO|nr:hypothetical protein H2204_007430 [Knufia peltigerae]
MSSKSSTTTPLADDYFISGHLTLTKESDRYEIRSWSLHLISNNDRGREGMPSPGVYMGRLEVPLLSAAEPKAGRSRLDVKGFVGNADARASDTQKDARVLLKPKLRIQTDIPLPLFPIKADQEEPSASSLTKFQESLERTFPQMSPRRAEHRTPEIQINGQTIGEENKTKQRESSSPVREWLEKRGDKARARKTGRWIGMWKQM